MGRAVPEPKTPTIAAATQLEKDFTATVAELARPFRYLATRIIGAADHAGANQVTVSLNRGAMPHEMFMHQIRRFAREVLPRLHAHELIRVPIAEPADVPS